MKLRIAVAVAAVLSSALTVWAMVMPASAAVPGANRAEVATCRAFHTWDHRRTLLNLRLMEAASVWAPWQPVAVDADVVYSIARTDPKDLSFPDAIQALHGDCARIKA